MKGDLHTPMWDMLDALVHLHVHPARTYAQCGHAHATTQTLRLSIAHTSSRTPVGSLAPVRAQRKRNVRHCVACKVSWTCVAIYR